MQILNMKLILVSILLVSSTLYAEKREQKIYLLGKTKSDISKRVTVKEIEKDLKIVEEKIYNPYEKRTDLYAGILISDFVQKYGRDDVNSLKLVGIDEYTINISKKDWESMRIILAGQMNNKYLSLKEKGPLRIVFPDYDPKEKKYQDSITLWMWMIKKIEFK